MDKDINFTFWPFPNIVVATSFYLPNTNLFQRKIFTFLFNVPPFKIFWKIAFSQSWNYFSRWYIEMSFQAQKIACWRKISSFNSFYLHWNFFLRSWFRIQLFIRCKTFYSKIFSFFSPSSLSETVCVTSVTWFLFLC